MTIYAIISCSFIEKETALMQERKSSCFSAVLGAALNTRNLRKLGSDNEPLAEKGSSGT